MTDYRMNRRLNYLPGGAIRAEMGMWPSGDNWWEPTTGSYTVVAAYQAKGAASLAASYVNLANPGTYDAAPGTAPTFDTATGWTFNGATHYLTTGITATNSMSAVVRFSNATLTNAVLFGVTHTGQVQFNIYAGFSDGNSYFRAGGNYTHTGVRYSSGVLAVTPSAAYANGSSIGSLTGALSGSTAYTIVLGAQNANGTITRAAATIQAIAFYSGTLDATQIAKLTTNINAL